MKLAVHSDANRFIYTSTQGTRVYSLAHAGSKSINIFKFTYICVRPMHIIERCGLRRTLKGIS